MQENFKVIIPAAGRGTRFFPFTSVIPKELLPIMQYPAIDFIVREYIASHVSKAFFIINEEKKAIVQYVENQFPEQKIEIVYQKEALGLGHAILQVADFFENSNEPIL